MLSKATKLKYRSSLALRFGWRMWKYQRRNIRDYRFYRFTNQKAEIISLLGRTLGTIGAALSLSVEYLIPIIPKFSSPTEGTPLSSINDIIASHPFRIIMLLLIVLPEIIALVHWIKEKFRHYPETFTTSEDDDTYQNVLPPDSNWDKIELTIKKEDGKTEQQVIFVHDKINEWLRSRSIIGMERDTLYEQKLRQKIRDTIHWNSIYMPFLRSNIRSSMHGGNQFYNEKKYGLSAEIQPGDKSVSIHKTCYYDTFLTNIIPGKQLKYNHNLKAAAGVPPCPCIEEDVVIEEGTLQKKTFKRLQYIGDLGEVTANELGVTTLCILSDDNIYLQRQNKLAQCSTGLIVASGSGSADWRDCKGFLNQKDGFRKAVIAGMEREFWEEADGERVNKAAFQHDLNTRIIGYFRWLKKGGKSEFVGLSRLEDDANQTVKRTLRPEETEVTQAKETLHAKTIKDLGNEINAALVAASPKEDAYMGDKENPYRIRSYLSKNYSVSCSAAMLALLDVCQKYCRGCKKDCEKDRRKEPFSCQECTARPYEVLFQ